MQPMTSVLMGYLDEAVESEQEGPNYPPLNSHCNPSSSH